MSNYSPKARRVMVFILSLALSGFGAFKTGSILAAENMENNVKVETEANEAEKETPQLVGQLIVTGSVTVNEKRAITGTTVFTDSRIAVSCSKGSGAIVNLGRLGRIELTPGARMLLRFSDGLISGDLLEGKATVSTPAGVKVAVNTPDGVSTSDGKDASVTPVVTQRGVRCVPIAVSSGSPSALSSGVLGALLVGVGGAAAAAAAVASVESTNEISISIPPI